MNPTVAIIGGGSAGLSSLIWCDSLGLDAILFEASAEPGGQMLKMYHRITDYPGLLPRDGRELTERFIDHIDRLNLRGRCLLNARIEKIQSSSPGFEIRSGDQAWNVRAVILAMGAHTRHLEIPGERKFENKGVSFSATRDHPLFAGKTVAVIGGGDSAVENSLILARVCKHVYLIHRSDRFLARPEWLSEARSNSIITIIPNSRAITIDGDSHPTCIQIEDVTTGSRRSLNVDGVFIRIGMEPNSGPVSELVSLDSKGFVKVDANQQTNIEMMYAAGDLCRPVSRSVATAVGHGANAAKHIATRLGRVGHDP